MYWLLQVCNKSKACWNFNSPIFIMQMRKKEIPSVWVNKSPFYVLHLDISFVHFHSRWWLLITINFLIKHVLKFLLFFQTQKRMKREWFIYTLVQLINISTSAIFIICSYIELHFHHVVYSLFFVLTVATKGISMSATYMLLNNQLRTNV